jgi:Cu-Zn family superoxide dismutase
MGRQGIVVRIAVLALIGVVIWLRRGDGAAQEPPASLQETRARAVLRDSEGHSVGVANLTGTQRGVRIEVQASGLTPGRHGFHIHENGRCDPPDFASAGGHFNPGVMHHGMENPRGPHGGDLPNLVAGEDGTATLTTLNPYLTLGTGAADDLLRASGTAVMIHAGPDDYFTDPAGDSGARVVCGVIERVP